MSAGTGRRKLAAILFTDISCRSSSVLSVPNKRFSSCAPKHPYTQALLSAVPVVDPDSNRSVLVDSEIDRHCAPILHAPTDIIAEPLRIELRLGHLHLLLHPVRFHD